MAKIEIAIITNKDDAHADQVIRHLKGLGREIFRLNTEDVGKKYQTSIRFTGGSGWGGEVIDEVGRVLNLRDLKVVWLRKPSFEFDLSNPFEPEVRRYVCSELKSLVEAIYSLPKITWVNNYHSSSRAKTKVQQLMLAQEMGLRIPKTLITNDPNEARTFFKEFKGSILVKSIYNANIRIDGVDRGIPSAVLSTEEFADSADSIALCHVQLQEYVEKAFELRITVLGQSVFAVRIDSQLHEKTRVDWRVFTDLNPHSLFILPNRIEDFCREFVSRQKLVFGAIDMIVTPDGEYVFLENNPFGQYLWLELKTGIPLSNEMAKMLLGLLNPQS